MKKILTLPIFLFSLICSFSQVYSPEDIRIKTDSILLEGNLLYYHEKAAWIVTDKAMESESVGSDFGGFLSYMRNDTVVAIIYSRKDFNLCIYELQFNGNFDKPAKELNEKRQITDIERQLLFARDGIISEIIASDIDIFVPDGFNLNFVTLPFEQGFKLYVMTGTSQPDIIPFGNDYIFITDADYKITYWRKFHSRLIPQPIKGPDGEQVIKTTHSHLHVEPFITATDISTFMLYGGYYGLNEFAVYSGALSKYFTYRIDENKVTITDRP